VHDNIPVNEILEKINMANFITFLELCHFRWAGQITTMPNERLPKRIFYTEFQTGAHSQCAQKKPESLHEGL